MDADHDQHKSIMIFNYKIVVIDDVLIVSKPGREQKVYIKTLY